MYDAHMSGWGFPRARYGVFKKATGVVAQRPTHGSYAKLYEKWFGFAPKESDM